MEKTEKKENKLTTKGHWDQGMFDYYTVKIKFREYLYGGIPQNLNLILAWIVKKAKDAGHELTTDEAQELLAKEMKLRAEGTPETVDLEEETEKVSCGFRSDEKGIYYESRCIKSALKQCSSTLGFTGIRRGGDASVGFKHTLQEGVFVGPSRLYLGSKEPTGSHEFVGHVTGPKGPRSILQKMDYVEQAELTFEVKAVRNGVVQEWHLKALFDLMQDSGLGARRSQGAGTFDLLSFEKKE